MTPTPAQIEAALRALRQLPDLMRLVGEPYLRGIVETALTAATEVGEQANAASISDQIIAGHVAEWYKMNEKLEQIEAATIERCAQVAETAGDHSSRALTIAAAIRALKDK